MHFKICIELTVSLNSQEYSVTEGNFVFIVINANKPSGTPYEVHLTILGAEITGRVMTCKGFL